MRWEPALLSLLLLGAAFVAATPGAVAESCESVGVSVDDDSCGTMVSVSGTGDASNDPGGEACGTGTGVTVACIALSGTGEASNTPGPGSCKGQVSCVAVDVSSLLDEHLPTP